MRGPKRTKPGETRLGGFSPHTPSLALLSAASSATMSDKPNMAENEKFGKLKLRETEMQQKHPLPSKETIEQEKQAGES